MAADASQDHAYTVALRWTGDLGTGTSSYRAYSRDHELTADGRPRLLGSSDPSFRGSAERWNPEQLLVAALSQCHLLQYLHLCAVAGVVVTVYADQATGTMRTTDGGARGAFTEVTLHPSVTVADVSMVDRALALHDDAHAGCYIARSMAFPVHHRPTVTPA